MATYQKSTSTAAVELARLVAPRHKGETQKLLIILAEQLEAASRVIAAGLARARERELSAVLNILDHDADPEEITTGEIEVQIQEPMDV